MQPPVGMPRRLATARPAWSAPVCPPEMTRSIMPQPYWHNGRRRRDVPGRLVARWLKPGNSALAPETGSREERDAATRLAAFDHVRRLTACDGVLESVTVAAGWR